MGCRGRVGREELVVEVGWRGVGGDERKGFLED